MTTDVLADELRTVLVAAKGCEFDLVPTDGPIARLALLMHEKGDRILAAFCSASDYRDVRTCPDCDGAGRHADESNCSLCDGSGCVVPYREAALSPVAPAGASDVREADNSAIPAGFYQWLYLIEKDTLVWGLTPNEIRDLCAALTHPARTDDALERAAKS